MNKLLFLATFFSLCFELLAACPKGSESGKTIIFLDLNNNPREIESTKRAACRRGESVIVLPEKGSNFDINSLDRLLGTLERANVSVNSFVISGHDGGGQFGGSNGFFSKVMLSELMQDHPQVQESVSSVLLLGCYTGVKQEIFDWKQILPNANLIAGYEGQAPLGDKPAGHSYIEGVLLREKEMNEAKNKAQLERVLRGGIKHITSISAAMYVHPKFCAPGTEHESGFYFRPLKGRESLQDLVTQECLKIKESEGPLMRDRFMSYYRGEKEIPKQTHGTELRSLYNFFREKGHCFEGDRNYPSPDKVLFTLFFDGVKQNYAHFFERQLEEFSEDFNNLKNSFEERFLKYADRKKLLIEVLKERAGKSERTYTEELEAVADEYQQVATELASKYQRQFGLYGREDDLSNLTPEDLEKYQRMQALSEYNKFLYQASFMQQTRGFTDEITPDALNLAAQKYQSFLDQRQAYQDKLGELFTKFEPPSKEFIEKSSRAEILAKAHELSKFQQLEFFNENVPSSMQVSYTMNESLVNLNCLPFEWHEFNETSRSVGPNCGVMGEGGEGDSDEEETGNY